MASIILKSGESFECSEGTILDAALTENLGLEYSCKRGNCESCECTLLSGEVVQEGILKQAGEVIRTCSASPISNCVISAENIPAIQGIERRVSPAKVFSVDYVGDVAIVKLRLPPATEFKFIEGQYLDLSFQGVKRSYSIASTSKDSMIELHIKRVEHGLMSEKVFNDFKANTLVRIDGPIGSFFVRESAKPVVFLATGTGFAPVQAMVARLIRAGIGRPVKIYWGNRYKTDFYTTWPEESLTAVSNVEFFNILSREQGVRKQRYVQDAAVADIEDFSNCEVYACGSSNMIKSAKALFIGKGLLPGNFYSDAFVATTN